MQSTIVVSPRERFLSVIPSLESLFTTIADNVPVVVVEGGTPRKIRQRLEEIQSDRHFELVSLDHMVTPNEARNIGARMAQTEFVAFCDNDIEYQPHWLEQLEQNAVKYGADVVAPMIFIGPNDPAVIHHAGGVLTFRHDEQGLVIEERHRLMNERYIDLSDRVDELAPVANEVCEFHCLMMRKAFYDRMGGLDERLITREQMDLALRARALDAKVTFEKRSCVTYRAKVPFRGRDIFYHLFRWSDELACRSMDAFEESWNVRLNRDRIRYNWIQRHRQNAVLSMFPKLSKVIGRKRTVKLLTAPLEKHTARITRKTRPYPQSQAPAAVGEGGFVEKLAAEAMNTEPS